MSWRKSWWRVAVALSFVAGLYAYQKPFHQFNGTEYRNFELPEDWKTPGEWTFARLMYPPGPLDGYSRTGRFTGDYHFGLSLWTQDYPRADRHFSLAVRRLTRLQVRSVEQPVDLEDGDDAFNWPWLYAVQVGEWGLTQAQGAIMREYLERGGFFMADDFHGPDEWEEFQKRIKFVFPDRAIEDIPNDDPIFHTVYDMDDRVRAVGNDHLREGSKNGGTTGYWRAIYDDHRRVMVAISYNSDLGDAWEWADSPYYPEEMSHSAVRLGVNYVIYAMSH
jgi:hypothetical protein